jgi:hypothetical protein
LLPFIAACCSSDAEKSKTTEQEEPLVARWSKGKAEENSDSEEVIYSFDQN